MNTERSMLSIALLAWVCWFAHAACAADAEISAGNDAGVAPDAAHDPRSGPASDQSYVDMAFGRYGGCGVTADGALQCWHRSETSCSEISETARPVHLAYGLICPPEGTTAQVAMTERRVCARKPSGNTVCRSAEGDQGFSFATFLKSQSAICGVTSEGPVECLADFQDVQAPFDDIVSLTASLARVCAVRSTDGSVHCKDAEGQDYALHLPAGTYKDLVFYSGANGCALATDGSLSCFGELGTIIAPPGRFTQLAGGGGHMCALGEDGKALCWGRGQTDSPCGHAFDLGGGTSLECGQAMAPDTSFISIAAAGQYSCGLTDGGEIECWGVLPWNRCASQSGGGQWPEC